MYIFFNFVFVHANHTQSTKTTTVRSFPEVVRSQAFTRLIVAKERSTLQVVDGKVEAI